MNELTLESLAKRVEALEDELRQAKAAGIVKDWRSAVGMFGDREMARRITEEGRAIREADRERGRRDDVE